MSIELAPEIQALVDDQVASGAYASPAAFISAAVSLLAQREQRRRLQTEKLRGLLQEAVDEVERGEVSDIDEAFDRVEGELFGDSVKA